MLILFVKTPARIRIRLLDLNLSTLAWLLLGSNYLENAALEARGDVELAQRPRERKLARKLSNKSLPLQETNCGVGILFSFMAGTLLVFWARFIARLSLWALALVAFLLLAAVTLLGTRAIIRPCDVSLDQQDILLHELYVNVLALDAGDLAVELIRILGLADVEARAGAAAVPSSLGPALGFLLALDFAGVGVEIVEKTEESGEVGIGGVEIVWKCKDHLERGVPRIHKDSLVMDGLKEGGELKSDDRGEFRCRQKNKKKNKKEQSSVLYQSKLAWAFSSFGHHLRTIASSDCTGPKTVTFHSINWQNVDERSCRLM